MTIKPLDNQTWLVKYVVKRCSKLNPRWNAKNAAMEVILIILSNGSRNISIAQIQAALVFAIESSQNKKEKIFNKLI